jgi:hypothetical protein
VDESSNRTFASINGVGNIAKGCQGLVEILNRFVFSNELTQGAFSVFNPIRNFF